ncbi:UPF0262 family protein [Roseospira marina]|uniref:UPF0262 protein F1188_11845 n=2 Tax=Roseospira marina TaxID=140057 RepID=A0A5M6IBY7_9PROT|nr:UPF0262 family protein [Roseospira marina]MBB4314715.1 uncharacterized protein (UPF0262 family) [Roseospira marina]MBB5087704.1 uncharacterized protein (UPF0262 family) [Roseospira marina]
MMGLGGDPGTFRPDERLVDVRLDETTLVRRKPEVEHERAVAIFDLIEENCFRLKGARGPYVLHLSLEDDRLVLDVRAENDDPLHRFMFSTKPFRRIVKDYFMVCESYYGAIRSGASPSRIESIDMGRRGLHNEGSALLRERLDGKIEIDHDTARRLFTLICVLHIKA